MERSWQSSAGLGIESKHWPAVRYAAGQTISTPLALLITIPHVLVTTSLPGLSIVVDGTIFTAPQGFNWAAGETHSISTSSPQPGPPGTRYLFSSWSDGGAFSHVIIAPVSATVYTANFNTQYSLTLASNPTTGGSIVPSPATPDTFYTAGTTAPLVAT